MSAASTGDLPPDIITDSRRPGLICLSVPGAREHDMWLTPDEALEWALDLMTTAHNRRRQDAAHAQRMAAHEQRQANIMARESGYTGTLPGEEQS